jgi:hypothetical protein
MKTIVLLASALLLGSASGISAQHKEFHWLTGTWKMKDKPAIEQWRVAKDSKTLEGISYRIKGADTTVTEEIKLVLKEDSFYYVPDVAGDQGPVDFKITQRGAASFVAENPEHDFPKLIRYALVRKDEHDTLEATIEGNGKTIHYIFVKVE